MPDNVHFISGLPRSGSTSLAALLRQNPRFHAGIKSPVWSMQIVVIAMLAVVAANSARAAAEVKCRMTDGHYVLMGQPDVVADFTVPKYGKARGSLFFHIRIRRLSWDFWYEFEGTSGYTDIMLISTEDPRSPAWQPPDPDSRRHRPAADQDYYGIARDLSFLTDVPEAEGFAPEYIFVPGFGRAVWYDVRTLASGNRYSVPRAFFKLTSCGGTVRP